MKEHDMETHSYESVLLNRRTFVGGVAAVAAGAAAVSPAAGAPVAAATLKTGADVRDACRQGKWDTHTSGLAPGFAQANLVILPRDLAYDFLLFCRRNPKPCPVLDVTEVGEWTPRTVAPGADLRTDLPKYRVWKDGKLDSEPTDITKLWRKDFVSFEGITQDECTVRCKDVHR